MVPIQGSPLQEKTMPRVKQPKGTKGSWQSPLKGDAYAEYSYAAFLKRVGVWPSVKPLADFWPKRGDQGDA